MKKTFPDKNRFSHQDLFTIIFKDKIQLAFSNVKSVLRLFLYLMVANCSRKKSFSQLKRIKNELPFTLSQDKLISLCRMCIESEKLSELSFYNIIEDFAGKKARKRMM